jgi:branched-chain amino acid transport system ATP-binding protein
LAPERSLLKLSNVSASYGRVQTLYEVNLELAAGKSLAVLGANGAGKTTLLRAISGLVVQRRGSIEFNGSELSRLPPHEIVALGLSHVPEGKHLFGPLTVAENIEMGALTLHRSGRRKDADEARDLIYRLFPILRSRSGQIASTLSGGEQQMLAIGRCLMGAPELIMFDEPSLGLAPAIVQHMLRMIRELNREGLTCLLVEQNVAVSLKLAAHAYVLENGRIALAGTGDALLADARVRQAYLGL